MDGFKERIEQSIQAKLSFSLSALIVVVAILSGLISFASAFDEAIEFQDDTLKQIASLLDNQRIVLSSSKASHSVDDIDKEDRVIVRFLDEEHSKLNGGIEHHALQNAESLSDGFHTQVVEGLSYRVLLTTTLQNHRIAVAQSTESRDEIALQGAISALLPLLILLPVMLFFVMRLVRSLFKPIVELSDEIDQRKDHELHPVDTEQVPVEVRSFVIAINQLLSRVGQSMEVQRRFVADAAHELRTPLTALSLQAERLSEAEMSQNAHERLQTLRQGVARGCDLMENLLSFAKAQSVLDVSPTEVSVMAVYRRVLEDLMPLIEAKQIDIDVSGDADAIVFLYEQDLTTIVKNLLDNAIRYTPKGGEIKLSVMGENSRLAIEVQDSGPGITLAERERVFDPFYRSLGNDQKGSGLGLAIVKVISDRIGATVSLHFSDEQAASGLLVKVVLPDEAKH